MITVLIVIICIFSATFFEAIFFSAFGLRIYFLLILFLLEKIDWRIFAVGLVSLALISDVVFHFPLGSSLLFFAIPLGILYLFSLFVDIKEGFVSYIVKFFVLLIHYILITFLPNLFSNGTFGILTWSMFFGFCIKSLISVIILFGLTFLFERTRREDRHMKITKKWN